MIHFEIKSECCGCGGCVQACPQNCISFIEDEEGFVYPHVNSSNCIECGICDKVCPVTNQRVPSKPFKVYAAINPSEAIRLESSSGGIFSILAEKVISNGGVVFGARFDKNWEVVHDYTESIEGLSAFRGSKYVQSFIGDSYIKARTFLKSGRMVLYSGTPCQIAGLNNFIKQKYDNLITIDVICHGVPSPKIWREYLNSLNKDLIASINFRSKQLDGFSWREYGLVIKENDGNTKVSQRASENIYLAGFSKDLYLRPSCHNCPAKEGKSASDITLGDYWHIWTISPGMYDNKGTSLVLANTLKGAKLLESINAKIYNTTYEHAVKVNPMLVYSTPRPRQKDSFWERYKNEGLKCVIPIVRAMEPGLVRRLYLLTKKYLKL